MLSFFHFFDCLVSRCLLLLLLLRSLLEALPDPSSCSRCSSIPHPLVTQHIRGELGLGLGETCSSSAVVAVDLCQHEEISKCGNTESKGDEENDEANEVVTASSSLTPSPTSEGDDCSYQPTSTSPWNPESHDYREAELTEEDEEEDHEVEARVGSECLVCRSEPTEEGERDEEEAVDEGEAKHGAIVQPSEEETSSSKQVCQHQQSVQKPQVVEALHHLLELHGDVHVDVLVEAGLAWQEARHGWPVVDPGIVGRVLQLLLPPS